MNNIHIPFLNEYQLINLVLQVHTLSAAIKGNIYITDQELPFWAMFNDLIILTDVEQAQELKQVSLNEKYQGDAACILISRLFNEFLPHYYSVYQNIYFQQSDEVIVPLLDTPFNADEQANKETN